MKFTALLISVLFATTSAKTSGNNGNGRPATAATAATASTAGTAATAATASTAGTAATASTPGTAAATPVGTVNAVTGTCMGDDGYRWGDINSGEYGCTAKDVRIASTTILSATSNGAALPVNADGTFECTEGETIEVTAGATMTNSASSERYDIGVWIASDGGSANSGSCTHLYFGNGAGLTSLDGDACGDLPDKHSGGPYDLTPSAGGTTFTITCAKGSSGDLVEAQSCISWKQPGNANQDCTTNGRAAPYQGNEGALRFGTLPGTQSKCNCEAVQIPIKVVTPPVAAAAASFSALASIGLQKTVYKGHDGMASCPGSEVVAAKNESLVTYCFEVTNTGEAALTNVVVSDPSLGYSATIGDLAPGESMMKSVESIMLHSVWANATTVGTPVADRRRHLQSGGDVTASDPGAVLIQNPCPYTCPAVR